jgi:penicillin-binding protein 1B
MRALKILGWALVGAMLIAAGRMLFQFVRFYDSLEEQVAERFSGQHWKLPSLIYSDSTMLYPGARLDEIGFFERLAQLNYHRVDPGQVRLRGEYSFDEKQGSLVLFMHRFRYPYYDFAGALVRLKISPLSTIESIEDVATDKPEYLIQLEPELLGTIHQGNWEQRRVVPLSNIPRVFVNAVLAAEDHRFYEHHGVDLARTTQAAWIDLTAHHVVQGGSTLTQQLMKNFFLSSKRDWHRKITEALMAYITEKRYSKDEILELYLNDIYLGQRGPEGIYGVWEASQSYFSREPRDLTIGQMATIAGMIRSPNRFNPLRHAENAVMRRNEVLAAMLRDGYISQTAYGLAVTEPLRTREPYSDTKTNDAPYFTDYVKQELAERYPPSVLTGEGLRIFTTLDVHMGKLAEQALEHNLANLEDQHPSLRRKEKNQQLESCLVALEPQTGKIRAMVGGRDYRQSQFNRVTQSHRQPGSAFKPITYLAALQETYDGGHRQFLPTSHIDDKPFTWQSGITSWTPKNYKDHYFGRVTLQFALQESLNSATLRLAHEIGLHRVMAMASKLGFSDLPHYPSVVLGGVEVEPMQLAAMYAVLANEGREVQPHAVTTVVDAKGQLIEGHELRAEELLPPEVAYSMVLMLKRVIKHGTGVRVLKAGFLRPAAGKTGTTNDSVDAWFAGFTPNLLAVVWTGFDQKEALGLTGAEGSLPAWTEFMKAATASRPDGDFPKPPETSLIEDTDATDRVYQETGTLDSAQTEDDPPPALDAGALEVGPELGNQSLEPEIGKATDPEMSASIRVTEDARKRLADSRVDDAMRDLARAVSLDPSNGFAYYYLGRAFLARKDYAQAGIFFRWAETAFNGRSDWSAEAFSYEGLCEENMGNTEDASEAYTEALQESPNNFRARIGYGRVANSPGPTENADGSSPSQDLEVPLPSAPHDSALLEPSSSHSSE